MGVKDLWNILSPLCETKPLFELQGKAVSIDLSCWVVESQSLTNSHVQPKGYLTILYFRTACLLQNGIFPVFVIEGKAPKLKHKTMSRRNNIRHATQDTNPTTKGNRYQFNAVLAKCEELLKYLGLSCIHAKGEAEALCSYLNQDGLVDGCISQDSDCFLYGAKKVYRNFCMSRLGGSIDVYEMKKIEQIFHMGRNKMIALALICGCDYNEGLNGIGKEAALKLFKNFDDQEILDRIQSWKVDKRKFDKLEKQLTNPDICTSCGHNGKLRIHTKKGCTDCGTNIKCNDSYKEKRAIIANELSVRKKALLVEDFPNQELIHEFLIRKDPPFRLNLQWKQPNVHKFVEFMERQVGWDVQYSFSKIFALLIRWQLQNLPKLSPEVQRSLYLMKPQKILKTRNRKGVASYEIVWQNEDSPYAEYALMNTLSKDKSEESSEAKVFTTIEPRTLVSQCYPQLVEDFEESRKPKPKNKTNKKGEPRRKVKLNMARNRKIDEFLTKGSLNESLEKLEITPKRKKREKNTVAVKRGLEIKNLDSILNNSLKRLYDELTPEDFPCECKDDDEVMNMIDKICGKKVESDVDNDEEDHDVIEMIDKICGKKVESDVDNDEEDHNVIEMIDKICGNNELDPDDFPSEDDENETSKAVDNICDNIELDLLEEIDESMDEFDNLMKPYVPLDERVKNLNNAGKTDFRLGISDLLNSTDLDD